MTRQSVFYNAYRCSSERSVPLRHHLHVLQSKKALVGAYTSSSFPNTPVLGASRRGENTYVVHDGRRSLHTTTRRRQQQAATLSEGSGDGFQPPPPPPSEKQKQQLSIRDRLRIWQQDEAQKEREEAPAELVEQSEALMRRDIQVNNDEDVDDSIIESFTQEFDRLSGQYEGLTPADSQFRPGDIIELPGGSGGGLSLAVFLRSAANYTMYYSLEGNICVSVNGQAHFIAPTQFTEEELKPIMAHVPSSPFQNARDALQEYGKAVPREVGAHVMKRLMEFQTATDEAFRIHSTTLNNIHSKVAHPTEPRLMSLEHIAAKVVGVPVSQAHTLAQPVLLAVSHALIRGGFGFKVYNRTYAITRQLIVESKYSVGAVERVVGWARSFQEEASLRTQRRSVPERVRRDARPLHDFIRKANKLRQVSRQFRIYAAHGSIVGTKPRYLKKPELMDNKATEVFSDHDQDIIHFLSLYVSAKSFFYHPSLVGVPAIVVRAIGLNNKDTEVDADTVHTLLVELGVMQPFINTDPWDRELRVHDQSLEDELGAIQTSIDNGVPVEQAAGLEDSMAHMRKDWGDMPVFCIDSASTTEVDDAVSLEAIPGSPGHVWFHVHVAHPSAFTSPDHVLGRCADNRYSSNYLPEGKESMLPRYISEKFSVQANAPVLTISARVDADCNIIDQRIQPAVVRNVITANSDAVDALLGQRTNNVELVPVISVGANSSPPRNASDTYVPNYLDPKYTSTLRSLLEISRKLETQRPRPFFMSFSERSTTTVSDLPPTPSPDPQSSSPFPIAAHRDHPVPSCPSYTLNFPSISFAINPNYDTHILHSHDINSPSQTLVSEAMILSNTLLARYAAARDIPIPYYGTRRLAEGIDMDIPTMRSRLQRMVAGHEPIDRAFLSHLRLAFGLRLVEARPIEHRLLGLECYTKATSPLRRYQDLLTCWQIDGALREEHRRGQSLLPSASNPDTATTFLPLSRASLDSILAKLRLPEFSLMRFHAAHAKHWVVQAFARALYLSPESIKPHFAPGETPPSDVLNPKKGLFTAIAGKAGSARQQMRLEGLEVACDSEDKVGRIDRRIPKEGERWAVKVQRVRLGSRRVVVELLKALEQVTT